jgi:hypothetical protein
MTRRALVLRLGLIVLVLAPIAGCSKQRGPVAVKPIAVPATPEESKEREKNPLINRD